MKTKDVLKQLRDEGFELTGVTIGQAIKAGAVERPRLRNMQFEYGPKHLRQIRKYLRSKGRK